MKFAALGLLFFCSSLTAKDLRLFSLVVTAEPAANYENVAGLFSRRLDEADIRFVTRSQRYKEGPYYPVPVCNDLEYFLFSPAEELLAIGCIDRTAAGIAVPEIRQAIRAYKTAVRKGNNPAILWPKPRSE